MKISFVSFFLLLLMGNVNGQQLPTSTQYLLNRFALNPAFAGIKPCGETNLGVRQQWVGFEQAPLTVSGSFHSRFNKEEKFPNEIHGYGVSIVGDRMGFETRTNFRLAYAYHIKVQRNHRLSFGIFGGAQFYSFSFASVNMPNKNIDPAFDDEVSNSLVVPEVSPGIFYYGKNFFLGASTFQIFPTRMYQIGTNDQRLAAHYFLTGGYRFRGKVLDVLPSYMMAFSPFAPPTVDFSLLLDFDQKIGITLGSKYLNSGYAILNMRVAQSITVGYAYEYALNEINRVAPRTNEIVLSITSCGREKEGPKFYCPAYQ